MSKEKLIKSLNEDLAAELGTVIRYNYQSGKSYGIMGTELREMFDSEIKDELGHARFLTDIIIDLGGEPVTTPLDFTKPNGIKEMLELDLKMEEEDVKNYLQHSKEAEETGLPELKMKLEEMAADEAGHARVLRRLLKGL